MKKPERFERAISKLVKAYFKGELEKGNCSACAVGNICNGRSSWSNVFMTGWEQEIRPEYFFGEAKSVIDSTGYTWRELARVEKAFETNTVIEDYYEFTKEELEADQYNGLMAVVDVLCDIEGFNNDVLVETKEMFVK